MSPRYLLSCMALAASLWAAAGAGGAETTSAGSPAATNASSGVGLLDVLQGLGTLLGVFAFVWKVSDYFAGYLWIELDVTAEQGQVLARTTVENKSMRPKKIENAVLLVGPENETPEETFNRIARHSSWSVQAESTNDIADHQIEVRASAPEGRQIVPLTFYYLENVNIADERVSYCCPVDLSTCVPGMHYSVRFFLSGEGRLHRSTHACFRVSPSSP